MTRTDHLLFMLAEECSEVAQRASKAARFGLGEIQPGQELSNAHRIIGELMDFLAVMQLLETEGHLVLPPYEEGRAMMEAKKSKVEKFLRYSAECGTLDGPTEAAGA